MGHVWVNIERSEGMVQHGYEVQEFSDNQGHSVDMLVGRAESRKIC